jgi:geranylgeranyl diphosphate synthase type I
MSSFSDFEKKYQKAFSTKFLDFINTLFSTSRTNLKEIFFYHLGLDHDNQGKRVRPFLLLMSAEGAGYDWERAIPAAIAVELIHNFSLIHDDIEDNGLIRRGKPAVWQKWGLAQGINSGDAMFASAFYALSHLEDMNQQQVLEIQKLFFKTCLELTCGQQMDICFSGMDSISLNAYRQMIHGKTAALLTCCMRTGAMLAGYEDDRSDQYAKYGKELGIAFQIYDDYLGIWGDESVTGKSVFSDLAERKISLPVLVGLERSPRFREAWVDDQDHVPIEKMAQWLSEDGVQEIVRNEYESSTEEAIRTLESMDCRTDVKDALKDLTLKLISRKN